MNPIVFNVILAGEMHKLAAGVFDLDAARTVSRMFKQRKSPSRHPSTDTFSAFPRQAMEDSAKKRGIFGGWYRRSAALGMRDKGVQYGQVTAPHKGDALTHFRREGVDVPDANYTPGDRQMIDSIAKGHELDETRYPIKRIMEPFGHSGPEVILDEHARAVRAREQGFAPAADLFGGFRRKGQEEAMIRNIDPNYRHGVSPRYSRHAKKRISERLGQVGDEVGVGRPSWRQRIFGGE